MLHTGWRHDCFLCTLYRYIYVPVVPRAAIAWEAKLTDLSSKLFKHKVRTTTEYCVNFSSTSPCSVPMSLGLLPPPPLLPGWLHVTPLLWLLPNLAPFPASAAWLSIFFFGLSPPARTRQPAGQTQLGREQDPPLLKHTWARGQDGSGQGDATQTLLQ